MTAIEYRAYHRTWMRRARIMARLSEALIWLEADKLTYGW